MENNPPNSSQNPQTPPPAPQNPETPNEKEKIGSLVERLRSYESDIAHLRGLPIKPEVKQEWNLAPEPAHKPFEIAGKPKPSVTNPGNTLKSFEAANAVPEREKPKEDPKKAMEALHKEVPIQQSRTIQTDIVENSKIQGTSIADIIKAEEEKNRIQPKEIEDPKRGIYILALSATLVVAGLIAVGVFYIIKTTPETPPAITVNTKIIIETKSSRDVIIAENQSLRNELAALRSQKIGTLGDIIGLNIKEGTSTPVDAERFATLFSDTFPTWLARSFRPQYLAGIYSGSDGWQTFMIFKLTSYDTAYSGMLTWEDTMQNDFSGLISSPSNTPSSNQTKTGFRDIIIKNRDVRALQDSLGRRLILYSFTDKNTLVIATNQDALEAVFAQLTTSKFVQ